MLSDVRRWALFLGDISKFLQSGAGTGVLVGLMCMRSINKKLYVIIKYKYKRFCEVEWSVEDCLYKMFLTVSFN